MVPLGWVARQLSRQSSLPVDAGPSFQRETMRDWLEPLIGGVVLGITLPDVFLTVNSLLALRQSLHQRAAQLILGRISGKVVIRNSKGLESLRLAPAASVPGDLEPVHSIPKP